MLDIVVWVDLSIVVLPNWYMHKPNIGITLTSPQDCVETYNTIGQKVELHQLCICCVYKSFATCSQSSFFGSVFEIHKATINGFSFGVDSIPL